MYFDENICEICSFEPVLCFRLFLKFLICISKMMKKKNKKFSSKVCKKTVHGGAGGAQNVTDRSVTHFFNAFPKKGMIV